MSAFPRTLDQRLSFQRFLRDGWSEPLSIPVGWSDAGFDPDGLRGAEPLPLYGAVQWLRDGLVQIDVVSRCDGDPLGSSAQAAADALTALVRAAAGRVPLYGYAAVVEAGDVEEALPGCLLAQDGTGRLGEPWDAAGPSRDREVWRTTITYRLRPLNALSGGRRP